MRDKSMKKTTFLIVVFLFIGSLFVFAQTLDVGYLDGTVELKTAKGWGAISIGDTLDPGATVRISKGGSMEISRGNQRITVMKDGIYALADLLKAGEKNTKTGVGVALTQKLRIVTAVGQQKGTSTVAGVRGAQQGQPVENLTWMDGDEDSLAQIQRLLDAQKYAEAVPLLVDAVDESVSIEDEQMLKYQLATAYYGSGQIARAYRVIVKTAPAADVDYYPDFVILKAEVLLDSLQFKEGQALLKTFIASKPDVGYAQIGYLLSAQCSKGLGDDKAASEALKSGLALDPQSETAKEIQSMLGS
jgi:tetratricopeptide (TPR) repeat protein